MGGFPGASNNDNGQVLGFLIAPPDTDGEVGPNHFVQMINSVTTIYDKNGNELLNGPFASNAFWRTNSGRSAAPAQHVRRTPGRGARRAGLSAAASSGVTTPAVGGNQTGYDTGGEKRSDRQDIPPSSFPASVLPTFRTL